MRKTLLLPLLLLAACPKEKTSRKCEPLAVKVETGGMVPVYTDVCGLGDESVSWWSEADTHFEIFDLPWYLKASFREVNGATILDLNADEHAPMGVFEGTYSYDASLTVGAPAVQGSVQIETFVANPGERFNLTLEVDGEGQLTNDVLQCNSQGDRCGASYAANDVVTLKIEAASGWVFASIDECDLQLDVATQELKGNITKASHCRANFNPADGKVRFDVEVLGGGGQVEVLIGGTSETVELGRSSFPVSAGTPVQLTAVESLAFSFVGWEGDCRGTVPETTLTADGLRMLCQAIFEPNVQIGVVLHITIEGEGSVAVGDEPPCGTETGCSAYEATPGEVVPLLAAPSQGHVFSHWGGNCSGTSPSTSITVNSEVTCAAVFMPNDCSGQAPPTVGQIVVRDGAGNVVATSGGEDCAIHVGNGTFSLTAENFVSNAQSPLSYGWDLTYQGGGDPISIEAYGAMQSVSWSGNTGDCFGAWVEVHDPCGSAMTYIAVSVP